MIVRRGTRQRRLILCAVRARCDHPTADQLYDDVRAVEPKISRATVYRNLNCLSDDGVICHVRVPGADRYDLRTDRHYHLFCVRCKKVIDAPFAYQSSCDAQLSEKSGFEILRHRLVFEGVCPDCQAKKNPGPKAVVSARRLVPSAEAMPPAPGAPIVKKEKGARQQTD